MKKLFTVLALLLAMTCNPLVAQGTFYPSRSHDTQKTHKKGIVYGIKGGVNFPRLYYTNRYVSDLPHDFMYGFTAGTFVEFPFIDELTIAAEIIYQQRGGGTSYIYEENYDVSYMLKANYVSLRVPFSYYFPISKTVKPYLFLAPEFGYALNGNISLTQPGLDIPSSYVDLNNSNINRYYFGVLGGPGIRFDFPFGGFTLVLKTDAAINYGFLDTFSPSEHQETATPTNVHAYNHQGKRFSTGLEINLGIGFIFHKRDDACKSFGTYGPRHVRY